MTRPSTQVGVMVVIKPGMTMETGTDKLLVRLIVSVDSPGGTDRVGPGDADRVAP